MFGVIEHVADEKAASAPPPCPKSCRPCCAARQPSAAGTRRLRQWPTPGRWYPADRRSSCPPRPDTCRTRGCEYYPALAAEAGDAMLARAVADLVPRVERSSSRRSTTVSIRAGDHFPAGVQRGRSEERRVASDHHRRVRCAIHSHQGPHRGTAGRRHARRGCSRVFPDFSVAKERARYVELLEPDDRNRQIYQEFFDLYKSIYSHVQDDFKSLQSLLRRTNS